MTHSGVKFHLQNNWIHQQREKKINLQKICKVIFGVKGFVNIRNQLVGNESWRSGDLVKTVMEWIAMECCRKKNNKAGITSG